MTYLRAKISIFLAQKILITLLVARKVIVLIEYLDFTYIFSKKSSVELFTYSNINKYLIDLEPDKQPPYKPIYNLEFIELKIFKTYNKINLANSFIQTFKLNIKAFNLFI